MGGPKVYLGPFRIYHWPTPVRKILTADHMPLKAIVYRLNSLVAGPPSMLLTSRLVWSSGTTSIFSVARDLQHCRVAGKAES